MERYESWIDRAKISKMIYFEDLCYQAQQAVENL
jgi:hypothetical protein